MDKSASILIVGGSGTFGLSAAWHLAKGGYEDITCIDRWPAPSASSAGYDRNKIVRTEYSSPVYSQLSQEAIELWKDKRWDRIFFQSGWIFGSDGTEELGREGNFHNCVANTRNYGNPDELEDLSSWNAVVQRFPVLASDSRHVENKAGFKAIYNGNAGWVKPVDAMLSIKLECEQHGVKFVAGPSGTASRILYSSSGDRVIGVMTADGTCWHADKVILAVGAYSETLLDFEGQLEATAYVVTHLRMNEEQYQRYKNIPVLNISRRGYCFPPNEDRVFKVCNTDISYIDIVAHDGQGIAQSSGSLTNGLNGNDGKPSSKHRQISIPRDPAFHPTDTQPIEAEEVTREFTRYILPEFTEAEIVSSRLCWDMESHDYNWLIAYHPQYAKSLFIATAGSGHSFKNIVNVGKYILQGLEGKLSAEYEDLWRWRPDRVGKDAKAEERAKRPKLNLREATRWKGSDNVVGGHSLQLAI